MRSLIIVPALLLHATILRPQDTSRVTSDPSITVLSQDVVRVGEPTRLQAGVRNGKPGATYTFNITPQPRTATFKSATGDMIWTPDITEGAQYDFSIVLLENGNRVAALARAIGIQAAQHAPDIRVADKAVASGQTTVIDIPVTDRDGDQITSVICRINGGACVGWDENARRLTYTAPNVAAPAPVQVRIEATDSRNANASAVFYIEVSAQQRSPKVVLSPKSKAIKEGELIVIAYQASDPNNDPLDEDVVEYPPDAEVNLAKRTITWTPSYNFVRTMNGTATAKIVVRVNDHRENGLVEETAFIQVADAPNPDSLVVGELRLVRLRQDADQQSKILSNQVAGLERKLERSGTNRAIIAWGTFLTALGVAVVPQTTDHAPTVKTVVTLGSIPTAVLGYWATRLTSDEEMAKKRSEAEAYIAAIASARGRLDSILPPGQRNPRTDATEASNAMTELQKATDASRAFKPR